jgi:eukaryotic-like serine/threonine-protein kinase
VSFLLRHSSATLIRFGPFLFDSSTGELRKHGIKIKLHGQPIEVLTLLLARPGAMVTREELQRTLWADNTFVDFESSLNAAVKRLRAALSDSPEKPRFIETLTGRGYRFIGAVELDELSEAVPPVAATPQLPREPDSSRPAPATDSPSWARTKLATFVFVVISGLAALLIILLLVRWHRNSAKRVTDKDTLVLADFANTTGDPVFDDTLKQAVSVELGQSPFLNILPDARVSGTLKLMTKPVNAKLTPELAQEVCQRAGGKAYVAGSIASLGKQYVIALNAVNCETGDVLAQEQAAAGDKEHVLRALSDTTTPLRRKLGESLASIQKFDTPIDEATTASLEALKSLSVGKKIQQEKGNGAAIPYFTRAIEIDPNFAAAYAALGTSYSNLREPGLAAVNLRKAYELRDHVSERERFRISAYYYHLVTGELEKAIATYQLWAQTYPRDNAPRSNLGVIYGYLGRYDQAVKAIGENIQLNPSSSVGYTNLVSDYMALGRLSDAKATYYQAISSNLDNPFLHLNFYGLAFLEGDVAEMQRQAESANGQGQAENLLLSAQSDTEAYYGHLSKARELSQRAAESARAHDQQETAVEWQMNAALRYAEFGRPADAQRQITAVLPTTPNREVQILAALGWARAGDSKRAGQIAEDLAQKFPVDTAIKSYWLPTIYAAIAINGKNPSAAIEILRAALPYELGNPLPQAELGAFQYPVYVRGQAYLMLGQGAEAAAEFGKIIAHRGITVNCPIGALARLGLARSYVLQGDSVKARVAYRNFLTLWKDADPDIPILIAAKSEYAKLQR